MTPVVCCANAVAQVNSITATAPENFLVISLHMFRKNKCPRPTSGRERPPAESEHNSLLISGGAGNPVLPTFSGLCAKVLIIGRRGAAVPLPDAVAPPAAAAG